MPPSTPEVTTCFKNPALKIIDGEYGGAGCHQSQLHDDYLTVEHSVVDKSVTRDVEFSSITIYCERVYAYRINFGRSIEIVIQIRRYCDLVIKARSLPTAGLHFRSISNPYV